MLFAGRNRKRVDLQRRHRRHRLIWYTVGALIAGYFLVLLIFNEMGLMKFISVVKTHRDLSQEIEHLVRRNHELRERARALRDDPETIESIARQELGLVKKGELVYQFKQGSDE